MASALAGGAAGGAAQAKVADADYLPLVVGSRWSFLASDGRESADTVRSVQEIRDSAGHVLAQAAAVAGADGADVWLIRTEKGVARVHEPPSTMPSPERTTWVLRFPLHLGARWESWTPTGRVEFRVTERRSITAPDGSLTDGIRVDFTSLPEPIFAGHIWYARGVGPLEVSEGEYSRKLLRYRRGDGPEVPVAKHLPGFEPPRMAKTWSVGGKFWFALALIAAGLSAAIVLPRRRQKVRPFPIPPESPTLAALEEELSMQAALLEAELPEAEARVATERAASARPAADPPANAPVSAPAAAAPSVSVGVPPAAAAQTGRGASRGEVATTASIPDRAPAARATAAGEAPKAPPLVEIRRTLAETYLALSRFEDALAQDQAALEIDPSYLPSGIGLARTLLRMGRVEEGLARLRPFAERHPAYADVQNLLGELLLAAGERSKAEAQFRRALAVNPAYERARANLARLGGTGG